MTNSSLFRKVIVSCSTAFFLVAALATSRADSATWNLDPTNGDWNTADNWSPATVPNGPDDTATFGVSNVTDIYFSANPVEVSSIIFDADASSFNITLDPTFTSGHLILSGAGIINNSGVTQNLTLDSPNNGNGSLVEFLNDATAGDGIAITVLGAVTSGGGGGIVNFYDNASAGSAAIDLGGALAGLEAFGGLLGFNDNATAGNASITMEGGVRPGGLGARVTFSGTASAGAASLVVESSDRSSGGSELEFLSSSSAGNATISAQPATSSTGDNAYVDFMDSSSAGAAVITAEGSARKNAHEPLINFWDNSNAGSATLTANGGSSPGAAGGVIAAQSDTATAGDATLIANGGTHGGSGGEIGFYRFGKATLTANGGTTGGGGGSISFVQAPKATAQVFGNGSLAVGPDASGTASLGSLAGDGTVLLGSNQLTVGSTNLSTQFSGVIQDDGSLVKSGAAVLTLSGANTYTGGTTVLSGTLEVHNNTGSATGSGAVLVAGGVLSGKGIISGAVTIGTGSGAGAFLAPGKGGSKPTTLTVQSTLTFNSDGSYICQLNTSKGRSDQVIANGVTIDSGAMFTLTVVANKKLSAGKVFTLINNTAATPISGTFANLADGSTVTIGPNKFQVSYSGGDGNDLTLTVVP